MAGASVLLAYFLDHAFGELPNRLHPVAWIGSLIGLGRDWALRAGRIGQFLRGAVLAFAIPSLSCVLAFEALRPLARFPLLVVLSSALLLKPMFAVRALRDAAFVVRDALDRDDLAAARRGLGSLCSRKADDLDGSALIAATVESVAENASDSVVAPLFYFACFGVPGAVFYRAVNTLDAMIGYHGRFEYVGKVSARFDDVLNFIPARLTALLLLGAGGILGADVRTGVSVLLRDGKQTESPNAGRPMAAMAGLLGVELAKPGQYALGTASEALQTDHITRAWRLVSMASLAALVATTVAVGVLRV